MSQIFHFPWEFCFVLEMFHALINLEHAPVLYATSHTVHLCYDPIAVLLEGMSGTGWLHRMGDASQHLSLALQWGFVSIVRSYLVVFLS